MRGPIRQVRALASPAVVVAASHYSGAVVKTTITPSTPGKRSPIEAVVAVADAPPAGPGVSLRSRHGARPAPDICLNVGCLLFDHARWNSFVVCLVYGRLQIFLLNHSKAPSGLRGTCLYARVCLHANTEKR